MADQRQHRGPNPEDPISFARDRIPDVRAAVADYSWLLTRGYAYPSALKLVGDRYSLTARQRLAVMRASCSDQSLQTRKESELLLHDCIGQPILIDGYNVLTTIEAGLAGSVLLICRDGCIRDLASMHGTWRKVEETPVAIGMIGDTLEEVDIRQLTWLLDKPVSNSGRLRQMILDVANENQWSWNVLLLNDVDAQLKASGELIATADSAILDERPHWLNLARYIVRQHVSDAWIADLSSVAP